VDILPNHAAAFCLYWLWCRRQCHVDFLPASDWAVYAGYYFCRYFSVIGLVGSLYIMQQVDGPFDHSYEFALRFAFASSLVAALAFGFEYWRVSLELQKEELGHKLDQEHSVLAEMTSVCAWCNSIKLPDGNWETFEIYVSNKENKPITHSICPNCAEENRFNADKD